MKSRRPITEDDVYLTELLIARSYGRLKHSVVKASSDALGSVGDAVGGTVRKHPYATAGAAVGAGIIMFMLFRLMNAGGSSRRNGDSGSAKSRSGRHSDILGMLVPIVAPYLTAYLEKSLGRMFARDRD